MAGHNTRKAFPLPDEAPISPLRRLTPRGASSKKRRTLLLLTLLLLEAAVALPLGVVAAHNHAGEALLALFSPHSPARIASPAPKKPLTSRAVNAAQLVAEDTFERPDQPFWGVSSSGQVWQRGVSNEGAHFSIESDAGQIVGTQGTATALLGSRLPDEEIVARLTCQRFVGGTNMGVVVRWLDAEHWYKGYLDGSELVLFKETATQTLRLGAVPFVAESGVPYTLRVRVQGSTFFVKAWPSFGAEPADWLLVTSDSGASWSTGFGGLRMYLQGQTTITISVSYFGELRLP
jgi:hypothetical protein